ncbi:MAG: hypothetical protein WC822_02145 [Candidatus Paceibacterota bacterium]|jgi:hypothetical protein
MALSNYHQKYTNYSSEEIENRVKEKRDELFLIFKQVNFVTKNIPVKIAVLGCGDQRFIKYHKQIFQEFIPSSLEIITFDITIDHLLNGENVVKHDCTLPLPNIPFDITYAHVLLKFIETEKQWDLIKNSYDSLRYGGFAIHVMDKEDYETKEFLLANGQFAIPLNKWKEKLNDLNIEYKEIPIKYGLAFIIFKK